MKKPTKVKIASLVYFAFIYLPVNVLAQNQMSIQGVWEVSEGLDSISTMDIWQFDDGFFCSLKYTSDLSKDLICDESGMYTITDSLLTIEINTDDGYLYEESLLVQFSYQYINEQFILKVYEDRNGMMKNMVTERLLMVRRR